MRNKEKSFESHPTSYQSSINASTWYDLYGHHPGRESLPRWRYGDSPNEVDGFLTAKDTEHSRFRRLMAHVISDKALRVIEPIFPELHQRID